MSVSRWSSRARPRWGYGLTRSKRILYRQRGRSALAASGGSNGMVGDRDRLLGRVIVKDAMRRADESAMGGRDRLDTEIDVYLDAARRGDQRGFTGLYRVLVGRVAGYVRSRGVLDVDDVVNEVFLGAFQNLGTFHGHAPEFRARLFAIAWNKVADWHRSTPRRPTPVDVHTEPSRSNPIGFRTDEQLDSALADQRINALLATLTSDQRDVLMMRVVADLSLEETAEALGKPIGAIKSLQHRALDALRRNISTPVSDDVPTAMTESK